MPAGVILAGIFMPHVFYKSFQTEFHFRPKFVDCNSSKAFVRSDVGKPACGWLIPIGPAIKSCHIIMAKTVNISAMSGKR